MMRALAPLSLTLALAACVQTAPQGSGGQGVGAKRGGVSVPVDGTTLAQDQGAAARKQAEALCAAQGLRLKPSIYDRYQAGQWHYREGCQ